LDGEFSASHTANKCHTYWDASQKAAFVGFSDVV
jgi:hypothetical protein